MAKKYYQTFTVKATFDFPIDMLRYDSCFPHSERDSALITQSFESGSTAEVTIGRFVETKKYSPPTIARWESFGCKIDNIKI